MGTRGWFALLHKGRYYRIYNNWDSYASGLGSWLVDEILRQGDNLEDLLINWRRLLDLGTIVKTGGTCHFKEPDETIDGGAALKEWNRIISSVIQKSGNGPVANWFQNDDRQLDYEEDEVLTLGDCVFIRFIYLIDLDDNDFSACQAVGDALICIYPFQKLLDEVQTPENWVGMFAPDEGPRRAYGYAYSFPLPKSLTGPLYKSIGESGYRALEIVYESYTAAICQAIDPSGETPRKVCIKVFLAGAKKFSNVRSMFPYLFGENEYSKIWDRAKPVAELLMKNPHPNIVSILGVTKFDRHPALILESYDGDLTQLDRSSAEGRRDYISAIAQAANATAHLHRLGIVHRDVKPGNVLFRKESKTGKIQAALCDFDTVCVPHIQKKPDWKNVGGRAISPSWKKDVDCGLVDSLSKKYDEHIKEIGEEDTTDRFAEFLLNSHKTDFDRKTRPDCVEYELKSERFKGILNEGLKSIRVPLVFKEALFRGHDWGPFSRAKDTDASIYKNSCWIPRWESDWDTAMTTEKYGHPMADHCERKGGCNPWVVDCYSLKVMLEDVKEAEQKSVASGNNDDNNGGTVPNKTSNVRDAIEKMIDVLNTTMQLKTSSYHDVCDRDIYDHEKSVLESVVSNLENLQIFLPAE